MAHFVQEKSEQNQNKTELQKMTELYPNVVFDKLWATNESPDEIAYTKSGPCKNGKIYLISFGYTNP